MKPTLVFCFFSFNPFPAGQFALPVLVPPEKGSQRSKESLSKQGALSFKSLVPHGDSQMLAELKQDVVRSVARKWGGLKGGGGVFSASDVIQGNGDTWLFQFVLWNSGQTVTLLDNDCWWFYAPHFPQPPLLPKTIFFVTPHSPTTAHKNLVCLGR